MSLAYHPSTGQLVYSPATGQLALNCEGNVGEDCYDCAGLTPYTITVTFAGVRSCLTGFEDAYINITHLLTQVGGRPCLFRKYYYDDLPPPYDFLLIEIGLGVPSAGSMTLTAAWAYTDYGGQHLQGMFKAVAPYSDCMSLPSPLPNEWVCFESCIYPYPIGGCDGTCVVST